MNRFLTIILVAMVAVAAKASVADYRVVPLPKEIKAQKGKPFVFNENTVIAYPAGNDKLAHNAKMLSDYLYDLTGIKTKITDKAVKKNVIVLADNLGGDNPEAYKIAVDQNRIFINGASAQGNFYGIQTLRKSVDASAKGAVEFPAVKISDRPRFGYRGAHFDVSRHFFPVDSVKTYIDMLAMHNINTFHMHLTDDQGWRVEIKKHPRLADYGQWRDGTMIGTDFKSTDRVIYGGYYTQDQLRNLVDYAADRYITIIPEIDLPGHMLGALAAYPELGCTGGPYYVWTRWGVAKDVLCAGNDKTYALIEDVLNEIMDIFPSEYIHIGGDECPKDRWRECEKCQAKIKQLGLDASDGVSAEAKLQSYVMDFASDVLSKRGRRAVGWDEILEGGASDPTVIMSWRGVKGARKAAEAGLDAILTPTKYCYFDYIQARDTDEQLLSYNAYLPIDTVYSFDPVPADFTPEMAKHILGAQCNLWCEYIPTLNYAQYKALPRLAAMCEVQWMDPEDKNFDDFYRRLCRLVKHYDAADYNYAKFVFRERQE